METPEINLRNVQNIRYQILKKSKSFPYYATIETATSVLTDKDSFPYTRSWRGEHESTVPIVLEREAGWRPRHDKCYKVQPSIDTVSSYPDHCFEAPCSTVFPCYPKYLKKHSDKEAMAVLLNKACIVQYR
jgi:hypothetical protein